MIDTFAKKLITNNLLIIPIIVLIIALYPFKTQFYMLVKITVFIFGIAANKICLIIFSYFNLICLDYG